MADPDPEGDLAEALLRLSDGRLLATLERVFAGRRPNPEEAAYNQSAYFLGTASRMREDDRDDDDTPPQRWGSWEIQAVAYLDREHYPLGHEDDCGFCEFGSCMTCGVKVRSYAKHGICAICASAVYMT